MVYRQVLVPDKKNHSIEMPEQFFGQKVEVTVTAIAKTENQNHPIPPQGKNIAVTELFEGFGDAPDFPSVEEIRSKTWPSKW